MTKHRGPCRIVLADDHPIVLSGVKSLIESDARYALLATCSDGTAALDAIRRLQPDLVVLDISMPGMNGLEVLERLTAEGIGSRVVFLTASARDDDIASAAALGAWGLLLKKAAADQLLECLEAVANGQRWMPSNVVDEAIQREAVRRTEAERLTKSLTPRERELVWLATEGLSNKEIARRIGVTEGTVKIHLHNVYQKLGVTNRTAMTALALAHREKFKR
jgi:two-component system nitrate/nitrite response regulator NarL